MVSLEYLPFYYKVSTHIWQLYTLGVGNFSACLNLTFDLYEGHMIKNYFLKEKLLATEPYNLTHLFILCKTRAD